MQCDAALNFVQDVVKGAGTPMELALRLPSEVQAHLLDCRTCRETAQDILSLDRRLDTVVDEPPPPRFVASVMAEISRDPRREGVRLPLVEHRPARSWRRWRAAAAALFVAAVGLLSVLAPSSGWVDVPEWDLPLPTMDPGSITDRLAAAFPLADAPSFAAASATAVALVVLALAISWRLSNFSRSVRSA